MWFKKFLKGLFDFTEDPEFLGSAAGFILLAFVVAKLLNWAW